MEKFIEELKKCLRGINDNDLSDIIMYYEEYFLEAGKENEENVIKELGSPNEVAMKILGELTAKNAESNDRPVKKWFNIIWIIVLGILASPIAMPLGIVLIVVLFVLVIAAFSLALAFFLTALALCISGFVTVILSVFLVIESFATSILFTGFGMVSLGLGLILFIGIYYLSKATLIWFSKIISKKFKRRSAV